MGNHVKAWRVLDFKDVNSTDWFNPRAFLSSAPINPSHYMEKNTLFFDSLPEPVRGIYVKEIKG
jgi:hypothetical protein